MTKVALVGGSGGIGHAMVAALSAMPNINSIHATYFQSPSSSSLASIDSFGSDTQVLWAKLDATNQNDVSAWMNHLGEVDWIINCAGYLHDANNSPEKSVSQFDVQNFNRSMQINCLPTLLLAKHAHHNLKRSDNPVFASISARVGSIADNRLGGWYSYRASKAALNMAIKTRG